MEPILTPHQFVFGYGSLVHPTSVGATLLRPVSVTELIPVELHGFRRVWRAKCRVYSESLGREVWAVFLDLAVVSGGTCNGVVFPTTMDEWQRLCERERNYDGVNVSKQLIAPFPFAQSTMTFCCRPTHWATPGEPECFVMRRYLELVRQGIASHGAAFEKRFDETTEPSEWPLLNGTYKFI